MMLVAAVLGKIVRQLRGEKQEGKVAEEEKRERGRREGEKELRPRYYPALITLSSDEGTRV